MGGIGRIVGPTGGYLIGYLPAVFIIGTISKKGADRIGYDIAAMIMEEAYDDLDGPVKRICGKNTTIPYNLELEKVCVPTVEEIVEGVLETI